MRDDRAAVSADADKKGEENMKRGLRKYVNAAFLCVLLSLLCWQCAWAEVFGGTEQEVYEAMVAMKAEYPEGMKYTNDDYYWDTQVYLDLNDNTSSRGGWGCGAFVWILSDAAFGDHAVTAVDRDYTKIRVGDVLRINGDTHSVIVLEVRDHSVIVAEGNYSGTIHWGRELDFSRFASDPQFERISRWPAASAVAEVLSSGSWKRDADGWYYEKADGARAKGWALISGAYYYFDEKTGIMWTGWALTADDRQTGDVCSWEASGNGLTDGWEN